MTKNEMIAKALKTMIKAEKAELFPPMTRKNFVVRESWKGRNQVITFTNNKNQVITYDHDKALSAMEPQLKFSPNWLKRKYWSQSTNIPTSVKASKAVINIVEPKATKQQSFKTQVI